MQLLSNLTLYRPNNFHAFCVILTRFSLQSHSHFFPDCHTNSLFFLISFNDSRNLISSNTWLHINANLWVKNVKLIHNWHPGKATFCNLAHSKTQNFFSWVGPSGRGYIHTILKEVKDQMASGLPKQEAKSIKSLHSNSHMSQEPA